MKDSIPATKEQLKTLNCLICDYMLDKEMKYVPDGKRLPKTDYTRTFDPKTRQIRFNTVSLSMQYGFLKNFLDTIDEGLKDYKIQPINISPSGYQLPSEEALEAFNHGFELKDEGVTANVSPTTIEQFFIQLKSATDNTAPYIGYVVGKKGSGKTAFIRYFLDQYSSKFDNTLVVYLTHRNFIYCESILSDRPQQLSVKELVEEVFLSAMMAESLKPDPTTRNEDELSDPGLLDDFLDKLTFDYLRTKGEAIQEDILQTYRTGIQHLIKSGRRGHSTLNDLLGHDKIFKKCWLDFYKARTGEKHFAFVDGFDCLSVLEAEMNAFNTLFNHLAEYIYAPDRGINYVIMLRHCTYLTFIKDMPNVTTPFFVTPVGITKIKNKSVAYFLELNKDKGYIQKNKEHFAEYFDFLTLMITGVFKLKDKNHLSELFDFNYRKLLSYYKLLNQYLCYYLITRDLMPDSIELFLTELLRHYKRGVFKKYVLLELFTLKNNIIFQNFGYNASRFEKIYSDRSGCSGFIDNIFDYSNIEHRGALDPLLIKYRVLQYLVLTDDYRSIDRIKDILHAQGYIIEKEKLACVLFGMQDCGFLKTNYIDDRVKYTATNMGHYQFKNLINEYTYIRSVVQTTPISEPIRSLMTARYIDDDLPEFIHQSFKNVHLFLMLFGAIETAEIKEVEKYCTVRKNLAVNDREYLLNTKGWTMHNTLVKNVSNSIGKICSMPLVTSDSQKKTYVNAERLIADLTEINRKLAIEKPTITAVQ